MEAKNKDERFEILKEQFTGSILRELKGAENLKKAICKTAALIFDEASKVSTESLDEDLSKINAFREIADLYLDYEEYKYQELP